MGLLSNGTPLSWKETEPYVEYIKKQGIAQFMSLYDRMKNRSNDPFKWGDEIEYTLVQFDHDNKTVRASLRAEELLHRLQAVEEANALAGAANEFLWRPEFASFMLEGTPGVPYGGLLACLSNVERNMHGRRVEIQKLLNTNESLLSISFPAIGAPNFTSPPAMLSPLSLGRSLFFPDDAIFCGNPRFINLVRNVNERRGGKIAINVPIFKDTNTPSLFVKDLGDFAGPEDYKAAKPDHIYLDHMGLGTSCCCLQMTLQATDEDEARWLYDQLTPITPILLALSAATPIFRSFLADVDSRWDVISASVDDRTGEERGLAPPSIPGRRRIGNSRYGTTDCFLHPSSAAYNDVDLEMDDTIYRELREGDIDEHLAKHISHIFIRDPLQVYSERLEQEDSRSTEHFETIQSSNWMNMRFKPPPPEAPDIGWRVEFRPTEVQLTDFENAAYCCFVVLLSRVLLSFRLSFLIPISLVNENMKRAQKRDAVLSQKFHFSMRSLSITHSGEKSSSGNCDGTPDGKVEEMSIKDVICGRTGRFPGLVPLIRQFLDSADIDIDTLCTISQYLSFIEKRASGEVWTLARWMRNFVKEHPEYKHDSRVAATTIYDLVKLMDAISAGREHCSKLLGIYRAPKTSVSQKPKGHFHHDASQENAK